MAAVQVGQTRDTRLWWHGMDHSSNSLHPFNDDYKGFLSDCVSANLRIVIRLDRTDAFDMDLIDHQ